MSVSRSAKLVLVGSILFFTAFVMLGEIASELLLMTQEIESEEEVRALDFGSLIYSGQAFIILLITAIITLILGGIFYKIDKKKGIPFISRKNESVSIKRQTIYAIIPILDLYAAYKIEKLIKYLVIILGLGIVMELGFKILLPFPYSWIASEGVLVSIAIYLIRKWSRKWNEQFPQLI